MSYYNREPKLIFKKEVFGGSDYLYIHSDDSNQEEDEDKVTWVYIELKNFWMKKDGKVLSLGNHLGIIYNLTGYTESMMNNWTNQIKQVIGFP
jgi:hypothetical protein